MENKIVKVLLTNDKIVSLTLTETQFEELQLELTGKKDYGQEYKTTDGEIITDLEIERIVEK